MIEQTREAVGDVYRALGMIPMNSRKAEQVQIRAAIMSSLGRFMHDEMVAEVLGKDRTTVLHHRAKHATNMKMWKGYAETYKLAHGILSISIGQTRKEAKIKATKAKIKFFEEEIAVLRTALEALENSED